MHFLVTGGLGYIGAHTIIQLYEAGHTASIIDNCINSEESTIHLLNKIVKQHIPYYNVDITKKDVLMLLQINKPDFIIHFAALKNVGDSSKFPFEYYENNLVGLLNMLEFSKKIDCPNFIFSSSATVYPHNAIKPLTEETPASASNTSYNSIITCYSPYGTSKLMCEQILHDISSADDYWNIIILRYFNPVGNHLSSLIGDNFKELKGGMNLFTAILNKKYNNIPVTIFGNKYPTIDGTAVRDYIHVLDVADAHIKSAEQYKDKKGLEVFNIGTGNGYSVLEIINKFNKLEFGIEYKFVDARKGDVAELWADCTKAEHILNWKPSRTLNDMVQSTIQYYLNSIRNEKYI